MHNEGTALAAALACPLQSRAAGTMVWFWGPVAPAARSALVPVLANLGYVPLGPSFFLKTVGDQSYGLSLNALPSLHGHIRFDPLRKAHLPLIAYWMQQPHMRPWWEPTSSQAAEQATKGYRQVGLLSKPIQSFVICWQGWPLGYIQRYDVRDFATHAVPFWIDVPGSCAGIDWYIGDPFFVGQGIGAKLLHAFMVQMLWPKFAACLVDPDVENTRAIRVYTKAGFHPLESRDGSTHWMLALRPPL